MVKILSVLFLGIGVFFIVQVVMPFLAFKFWEVTAYHQDSFLVDPYPTSKKVLGVFVENVDNFPAIVSSNTRVSAAPYSEFRLYIPKIELDWGKVIVDSNNFNENLAHLSGSALPGEKGNVFITGHSTLTQLYRQGNYKAIFAKLPELKRGDQIDLQAGGQIFSYFVEGVKIVDPNNTSVVLPPDSNGRYLTLMTCVPPGFNTKRLVVLARLK